jgi:hypothetical protein
MEELWPNLLCEKWSCGVLQRDGRYDKINKNIMIILDKNNTKEKSVCL